MMSPTQQRDRVHQLAKSDRKKAMALARKIPHPWYRAQALSSIAEYAGSECRRYARLAAKAASECKDDYGRSAVRTWEIDALVANDERDEAGKVLREAFQTSRTASPPGSRSEALLLLMTAAIRFDIAMARKIHEELILVEQLSDGYWRCSEALKTAERMISRFDTPNSA